MAIQSRAPAVLMTRPAAQSEAFVVALQERFPLVPVVISSLLVPRFLVPHLPKRKWTALIFTSQTAVEAARRMVAAGETLPTRAFCVGNRTALKAAAAGFVAISAEGDAQALVAMITAQAVQGPLLHLHGQDTRGDVGQNLCKAGVETVSEAIYTQDLCPLTAEAVALLLGPGPVLAPVFSPRSAEALARECRRIGATAALSIIAISPAAAQAFGPGDITIARQPDASAMIVAMALRMNARSKP